eukprot:4865401-Prymnesium_polylepis.1
MGGVHVCWPALVPAAQEGNELQKRKIFFAGRCPAPRRGAAPHPAGAPPQTPAGAVPQTPQVSFNT